MSRALEWWLNSMLLLFLPKMGTVAVAPTWNVDEDFVLATGMNESESEIKEEFFSSLIFNPANPADFFSTVELRVKVQISRL